MWSQPRISALVHIVVATGLMAAYIASVAMKQRYPDWYQAGLMGLLPAAVLNFIAAGIHVVRLLRA